MITDIAIYGAGGFGKEVACLINKINEKEPTWSLLGFFDDEVIEGQQISHFGKVLGNRETLNTWPVKLSVIFAIGSPKILKLLADKITNPNISFPNLFHPDVFFADPISFNRGKGNLVTRGCSFSCDVSIGDFNQFNSISALAHDVKIGSFNVFMPLTRISGEVTIGNCNFFGIGSVVLQQVRIGNNTRIGAGSMVMTKTKDGHLYMGNPARKTEF